MNKWRTYTVYFIGFIILAIAVYDVLAISQGGTEASISHVMIEWSYNHPVFTFVFGFVSGHLFWRTLDTKKTKEIAENVRGKSID